MSVGDAILLINDHDPKPLFYQFQAERPGEVSWAPQEQGPERWVIRIERVGAPPAARHHDGADAAGAGRADDLRNGASHSDASWRQWRRCRTARRCC